MLRHLKCRAFAACLAAAGAVASGQPSGGVGYVELDGLDDLVTTPGEFVYEAMTVEAWVRPTSLHPRYTSGVVSHGARDKSSFDFGIGPESDTRLRFFINWNQGQKTLLGNQPVELGQWQHVAATYDGQTARLYIDGELDAEQAFGAPVLPSGPDTLLAIGDDFPGSSEFLGGSIDEVRVWSVVRSGAEIAADMFTPLEGDEPGLELYYPFDECGSQVVVDRGPRGLHGRLGLSYSSAADDPMRVAYAPSRRRCFSLSSSDPGEVRPVVGFVDEQLSQINAGPPALGWMDIEHRHADMHERDAFECGEHLDRSYVDSETYLDGADEVTLDNCASAFYRVRFAMPPVVRDAAVYAVANADDLAVAFVNDRRVSPALIPDDVANLGWDRSENGRRLLGWPSPDPIVDEGEPGAVRPGVNGLTFGVCSDASELEPAGLEFEAVVQYECVGDWNADGEIDTRDFLAYQISWDAREPDADLNQDGRVNTRDMSLWLNVWTFGCPE